MKMLTPKSISAYVFSAYLFLNIAVAQEMDHSKMDHSSMQTESTETKDDEMDHSKMDHSKMNHALSNASLEPVTPFPEITDADRLAAFPKVDAHTMHGEHTIHNMILIDQLEMWDASPGTGLAWDAVAWWGSDMNRLWLRTEGERLDSELESAELEVLFGRSIAPWWDVVAGIRHDFKPGQPQDFFAFGVMGLSPYKFETDITLYIGESGQTAARLQFEYETLFTNRLILQPKLELNFYGKDDLQRGVGSGLSNSSIGMRLRYEITRQFAPYVGLSWDKSFGQTADYLRNQGESTAELNLLAGVRVWF